MKKIVTFAFVIGLVTLLSSSLNTKSAYRFWGANGHRITGQIGELNLTAKAEKRVREISGNHSFAFLATWPDDVRSDKKWDFMKSLHFISVDDTETLEEVLDRTKNEEFPTNVVEALEFFADILGGNDTKKGIFRDKMPDEDYWNGLTSVEEISLAYLIHFSGDIHQPMHVGRTYDLGGNKIPVTFFGKSSNLHSVWDSGIIEQQELSYSEYAEFLNHASDQDIAAWQANEINDWAQESIDVRLSIYKATYAKTDYTSKLPDLSYPYNFQMKPLLEERLLKGGIRLAGLVNGIFK